MSFEGGQAFAEDIEEWVEALLAGRDADFLGERSSLVEGGEAFGVKRDLQDRFVAVFLDLD